jgi:hypothetical protein
MNSSQLSKENSNNELFEEVEAVVHYHHSDEQTPHLDNSVELGVV